jgi:hypothetical protein
LSEEGSYWIKLFERFFGAIILVVGALAMYDAITSLQVFQNFAGFFVLLNILLILFGLILLTAKTE